MKPVIITLYFALFLASGCNMSRWCAEHYPPEVLPPQTVTVIKDTVIYRDTIIYIHLLGSEDTAYVEVPCPDPPAYIPDTARAETQLAEARAWLHRQRVNLVLIQKDTTIVQRLDSALVEARYWQHKYTTETKVQVKYEAPPWWRFTHYGFFALLGLLVIIFTVKRLTK